MNREEALEIIAKERDCSPDDLVWCNDTDGDCADSTCTELRKLMKQPSPDKRIDVLKLSPGDLVTLPSGDVMVVGERGGSPPVAPVSNPKTLMGNMKVPNLSVVPFTGLIHEARAMEYGARHAPRKDGTKGYGPFNWRDQKIEYLIYAEAAIRHIASAVDREDIDPDTGDLKVWHLGLAKATLGILIDAIEHGTVIDDRSPTARGRVAQLLRELRKTS